jgi:hypothetical protein
VVVFIFEEIMLSGKANAHLFITTNMVCMSYETNKIENH